LLWFFPFMHARTSAESLGTSFFYIGICIFCLKSRDFSPTTTKKSQELSWQTALLVGVLFGLSFVIRYQIGLMLVGLGLWTFLIQPLPWKTYLGICLGGITAIGAGLICERIGYGEWTFSAFNYFRVNFISEGLAYVSNKEPWWRYFYWCALYLPPLSTLLLIGTTLGCLKKPKHILVWALLPYLVAHCWISAKDLRYLFPILPAVPILCGIAWTSLLPHLILKIKKSKWGNRGWKIFFGFLLAENFALLSFVCLRPACSAIPFYSYLYHNFKNGIELYTTNGDPFEMLDLRLNFYKPKNYAWHWKPSFSEIEKVLLQSSQPIYVYHHGFELPTDTPKLREHCHVIYRALPTWIKYLNVNDWVSRSRPWMLYQCSK